MIVTSQPIKRKQQQKRKQQFWKKEWNGRRGTRTRSPWVKTFGFHRDLPLLPEMASAFFVRPLMFDISHQSPRLLHDTNGQHICLPEAQESDISDNRNKFPAQVSLMHSARFRIRKKILSFQADKAGTVIIYKICNRSPLVGFELRKFCNNRDEIEGGGQTWQFGSDIIYIIYAPLHHWYHIYMHQKTVDVNWELHQPGWGQAWQFQSNH